VIADKLSLHKNSFFALFWRVLLRDGAAAIAPVQQAELSDPVKFNRPFSPNAAITV